MKKLSKFTYRYLSFLTSCLRQWFAFFNTLDKTLLRFETKQYD